MPPLKRQLLQKIAIFGALSNDTLDFLLRRTEEIRFATGDYVFRENDNANAMFIIESGKVAVLKNWEGKKYLLDYLETGDCFGEMALMDMHPRSASVVVIEQTRVFKLGSPALFELHQHDLEQFVLFQMNLGREVSRRLREAHDRMFLWRVSKEARSELPLFSEPSASTK
jgi:CRP-like cAMP-binding protein